MKSSNAYTHLCRAWCVYGLIAVAATAAPPVVKTVPWVASNPLVPHTTFPTKEITLKGTCDQQGSDLMWTWDFGDGSPVASGTVTDMYVIEARHTYSAPVNTVFTARLTVANTATGESGNKAYYVLMADQTLESEVNVAIDEGLWYLHKTQERYDVYGQWWSGNSWGNSASLGYPAVTVANVNAFEVNGHVESGSPDDPYVETVGRGMRQLFAWLESIPIGIQTPPDPPAPGRDPDSNGNGIGITSSSAFSYQYYQGGMFMDAIVASGTPNAVTTTGGTDIIGRTYKDIVQDMVDAYAWAQYDGYDYYTGTQRAGGWRYSANEFPDNSACQWAAIGLLAAERVWGCTVPQWVKDWNVEWLQFSQNSSTGEFGYTDPYPIWGPYATTPSGMVQMVLDGIGRGSGMTAPSWELAETFMRDNFGNTGDASQAVKSYYYGMFSFVKSMLLHGGVGGPITMLHSATPGVPDIDWYKAEVTKGDPTDGVARTLVDSQNAGGYWWGHNFTWDQYYFETAWAIMMLHQTVFESGAPVAVAKAIPNPAIAGQNITLDGSDSYSQDPTKHIVKWEWDLDASGVFIEGGPLNLTSFGSVGIYPIKLRVTDDASPAKTAVTTVMVNVSTPPLAPTADANGPYHFCPAMSHWYLDGRNSRNPDEGGHQPGSFPGDTIQEYAWDLDGDNDFNDAFGATADVKQFFTDHNLGVGSYLISLRVTDTTAASYPDSGMANQSSIASAVVHVDPQCACVELEADPVIKAVMLSWTALPEAHSYNLYRSNVSGGPYTWFANTTDLAFKDDTLGPLDLTYYYIVRPAALNGDELCQSDEASAEPLHPAPIAFVQLNAYGNVPFYYKIDASSQSVGHMQMEMFVGDSASGQVVGPMMPGSIIYLRTHYRVASVRNGTNGIAKFITVKGDARVWAKDALQQLSPVVIVP